MLSALSLLSGSVLLLVAGTIAGEWRGFSFARITPRSWAALAYLILFGSVIAFSAYNWLLEHYSPTLVATHTYVNPIVAVLLGWLLAGERVTLSFGIAAAMVMLATIPDMVLTAIGVPYLPLKRPRSLGAVRSSADMA